jgi:hypothetical protein
MATLTSAIMYELRSCQKLALPQSVQDNIARLRITPMSYRPARPPPKFYGGGGPSKPSPVDDENWRKSIIKNSLRKVKEHDDPEYVQAFIILNKLSSYNIETLVEELVVILKKRNEEFRIRFVTLVFNKSISEKLFTTIMADCIHRLSKEIPEIKKDILEQIDLFPKLYDMNETITFPSHEDPEFDNKLKLWVEQKEKRRGYSKFISVLFIEDIVSEEMIFTSLKPVIDDLNLVARQPKNPQTEENTNQYVDFLFENANMLRGFRYDSISIKQFIKSSLEEFMKIPRPELPSLSMRSRFKVEDILKCVQ